jgi:serine/threonine protein kinase/tetratricopeptide (TPR) repeat protein
MNQTRDDVLREARERSEGMNLPRCDGTEVSDCLSLPIRQIGPYQLKGIIGEGATGTVYLADQQEPVQRTVALKLLNHTTVSTEATAAFQLERQSLSRLKHNSIVKLLEVGKSLDGQTYIATEFVSGCPVTEYCRRHAVPVHEKLEIFVATCDVIRHAHQRGVIHGDIRPANVFVVDGTATAASRIRVLDCGFAGLFEAAGDPANPVTPSDSVSAGDLDTLPKRAVGGVHSVDTRTDVHALGALLFELLTGTTAFVAGGRDGTSVSSEPGIDEQHPCVLMSSRLKSLTEKQLHSQQLAREDVVPLADLVSGDLDAVVAKALNNELQDRYQSVGELSADVNRYLACRPITAGRPTAIYVGRRFLRRHRTAVGVASTLFAVVVLAIGLAINSLNSDIQIAAIAAAKVRTDSRSTAETVQREAGERDRIISQLASANDVTLSLVDRLAEIRKALSEDVVDTTVRCDLQLAELDVLHALQRNNVLRRQLNGIAPIDERQTARIQLWDIRLSRATTAARDEALKLQASADCSALPEPDQVYLKALTCDSRVEAIALLEQMLVRWPRHQTARSLLLGCLLFEGRHEAVLRQARILRVLRPNDPETETVVALSFVMQDAPTELRHHLEQSKQVLTANHLKIITNASDQLAGLPVLFHQWDANSLDLTELLRSSTALADVLDGICSELHHLDTGPGGFSSSVVIGRAVDASPSSDNLNRRFVARMALVKGGVVRGDHDPFRKAVDDVAIASAVSTDALFPFLKGLSCYADGELLQAIEQFKKAQQSPCVFRVVQSEIAYALAATWAAIHVETKNAATADGGFDHMPLNNAAVAASRWQEMANELPGNRVGFMVRIWTASEQYDQAIRVLDRAERLMPGDKHQWDGMRLPVLDYAGRDFEAVELANQMLADPSLDESKQDDVRTIRDAALDDVAQMLDGARATPLTDSLPPGRF